MWVYEICLYLLVQRSLIVPLRFQRIPPCIRSLGDLNEDFHVIALPSHQTQISFETHAHKELRASLELSWYEKILMTR